MFYRGLGGCLAAGTLSCLAQPAAAQTRLFDVAAQPAVQGIPAFARQAGVQIIAPARKLAGKRTNALKGVFSVDAALAKLLAGTGLKVGLQSATTISLILDTAAPTLTASTGGDPSPETDPVNAAGAQDIVVVGSRGRPRAVTDTASPTDVISAELLRQSGFDDLNKTLESLAPSFNYPRGASSPSVNITRAATLRGLQPDQTLVLVNGQRRHASAILNTNNTVGRGTVPFDLNTIPTAAIARIEVLRDGAAAQYGSDAIAGVINVVLKNQDEGGEASLQSGVTQRGDGGTVIGSIQQGLHLGQGGHLMLTGEVRRRDFTNSADIDPRVGRVSQRTGDPRSLDLKAAVDWAVPLTNGIQAFGFLTFDRRDANTYPTFRLPSVARSVYPDGFVPRVDVLLTDFGGTAGLRGKLAGWSWSLTDTVGFDRAIYTVSQSVNTSLIASQSPVQTKFEAGGQQYRQNLTDLTVTRPFDLLAGASLSMGLEYRLENYKIIRAEPNAYAGAGVQGISFNPPRPVDVDRHAFSAFVDGELSPVRGLDLGAAARFEDYSDFGSRLTGKLSAFWRPIPQVALRGTANTGFRAPSLQQQRFANVTTQADQVTKNLVNIGTFSVNDPIAIALGARPLKAESSRAFSFGTVVTPSSHFTLTADYYQTAIKDRILLSESFSGAAARAVLLANGVTNADQARFFTNAADTTTHGWEATATYNARLSPAARLSLTAAYGAFRNQIDRLRPNLVIPSSPLVGQVSAFYISKAQPRDKATLSASLDAPTWRLNANVARYGSWTLPQSLQVYGSETIVDLSALLKAGPRLSFQIGVLNATDNYPDRTVPNLDGRPFDENSPIGSTGREFYVRLTRTW